MLALPPSWADLDECIVTDWSISWVAVFVQLLSHNHRPSQLATARQVNLSSDVAPPEESSSNSCIFLAESNDPCWELDVHEI